MAEAPAFATEDDEVFAASVGTNYCPSMTGTDVRCHAAVESPNSGNNTTARLYGELFRSTLRYTFDGQYNRLDEMRATSDRIVESTGGDSGINTIKVIPLGTTKWDRCAPVSFSASYKGGGAGVGFGRCDTLVSSEIYNSTRPGHRQIYYGPWYGTSGQIQFRSVNSGVKVRMSDWGRS